MILCEQFLIIMEFVFLIFFKSVENEVRKNIFFRFSPFCLLLQVTVNWFQMQQAQLESLPAHYLAATESAKLYEPGECYAEFARNLPKNLPKERLLSDPDNARYSEHVGTDFGLCKSYCESVLTRTALPHK